MAKLACVGTGTNSFGEDGGCINKSLPWSSVSDFVIALEESLEIGAYEFYNKTTHPSTEVLNTDSWTFMEAGGVLMAYDEDADVHYFYA